MTRQARLLALLGPRLPLPVPAPRFAGEERGVLAYPLVPGRPLLGRRPPPGSARRLGEFLRGLHDIDPAQVNGLVPVEEADPARWLDELESPPDLVRYLRACVPPPARRRVVAHADLGAEHILDDGARLTGVIDWSDAAITDPALDFARLHRDFGPDFLADALDAYGGLDNPRADMDRIAFFARCAALEDLAYGRDTGRREYTDAARRSITRLFPPWTRRASGMPKGEGS